MYAKRLISAGKPAMTQYVLLFASAIFTAVLTAAVVIDSVGWLVGNSAI